MTDSGEGASHSACSVCSSNDSGSRDAASKFGTRLHQAWDSSMLMLAVAMGGRTGIWDILADETKFITPQDIAAKAGLKERYIKELLGLTTSLQITEVDSAGEAYFLPEDKRDFLVGPKRFDQIAQVPVLFSEVFEDVAGCFPKDGPRGVSRGRFTKLYKIFTTCRKQYFHKVSEAYVNLIPGLAEKLDSGISVCDIGCNEGDFIIRMAGRYPNSTFHGIDYDHDAIEAARHNSQEHVLKNAYFVANNVGDLPASWTRKFDIVFMFDTLHDLPYPEISLQEIYRVIKDGGNIAVIDLNVQSNHADSTQSAGSVELFSYSLFVCMPGSLWHEDSAGLGTCMGKETGVSLIKGAKFKDVSTSVAEVDKGNMLYLGWKK